MRRARPDTLETDILVLGAGLAGLRAAIAARQAAPMLRVTLVSPRLRPSGSSFANRNNALGMQAPRPDQAAAFVAEVLRLAPPGLALPPLVEALAQDAPARLADLLDLGLAFRHDPNGSLRFFPGCFSTVPRAVVFDGLARAHAAFWARARALGVEPLHGFEALALAQHGPSGRVTGALLHALRGTGRLTIRARAVIAALGGPAPLFARRICGPGGSGLAYGLLKSAGARLANTAFLQWFWVEAASMDFVNPAELAWPEQMAGFAAARRQHCPMAYGLPDAALDLDLLARQDSSGVAQAGHPQRGPLRLVLAAHAGNGGALIDPKGRTSVAGLYACGECAAGMHGANRLGGGMVLSALVFGARAGRAAAREAGDMPSCARHCGPWTDDGAVMPNETPKVLRWLRRNMQRLGLPCACKDDPTRRAFSLRLRDLAHSPRADLRARLLARSALAVLE